MCCARPHRHAAINQLLRRVQDTDSIVRDACGTFLESVMAYFSQEAGSLLPGSLSQPIVKLIFDSMYVDCVTP